MGWMDLLAWDQWGDNLFYGQGLTLLLRRAAREAAGATVFGYEVSDTSPYGVAELSGAGRAPVGGAPGI